jgi:hypothetical protein
MSRSEKLVDGLAVALLLLGLGSGVLAKPMNKSPHETELTTSHVAAQPQSNQEARRPLSHA